MNITVGMTGLQTRAALNNVRKEYNVKDYGAVGNGVTDDTVAIQSAINTCMAAGGGVVYFPNGVYIIGGALQTSIGGLNPNSQLYIPAYTYVDADRCSIALVGEVTTTRFPVGLSGPTIYNKGVILKSTLTSASGTRPSVIGVVPKILAVLSAAWVAVDVEIKNILVFVEALVATGGPCLNGINGSVLESLCIDNCSVSIDVNGADSVLPENDVAGILIGFCNTSYPHKIINSSVCGFKDAIISGEHVYLNNIFLFCCETAIRCSAANYITTGGKIGVHWCKYTLGFLASALYGGNLNAQITIQELTVETITTGTKWYDTGVVVNDVGNKIYGEVHFIVCNSGTAGPDNTKFTKTGGTNLRCMPLFLPVASATVSGSKGANAALTSLIAALVAKGLIVDTTT